MSRIADSELTQHKSDGTTRYNFNPMSCAIQWAVFVGQQVQEGRWQAAVVNDKHLSRHPAKAGIQGGLASHFILQLKAANPVVCNW